MNKAALDYGECFLNKVAHGQNNPDGSGVYVVPVAQPTRRAVKPVAVDADASLDAPVDADD